MGIKREGKRPFGFTWATFLESLRRIGLIDDQLLFDEILSMGWLRGHEGVRKATFQMDIPQGGTVFGFEVKSVPP
jgi:hypothetical protein